MSTTTTKTVKIPGPDHPITIERTAGRVTVELAGRVDVDMSQLERSSHASYCPYKGDASYFSIPAGGERSVNAIWTYESPYDAVAAIKDHVAFYPDRIDSITIDPAA